MSFWYNVGMFWNLVLIFLVSMVPLIELRGAVPIGVGMGVPEWLVFVVAMVGNFVPVPLIFRFARRFLAWGASWKWKVGRKFCEWCLKKGEKAGEKMTKKTGNSIYVALALFVGIPVPGTGAWTGTLAASMLNLDERKTMLSILMGLLLAGGIMMLISMGVFSFIG